MTVMNGGFAPKPVYDKRPGGNNGTETPEVLQGKEIVLYL